MFKLLKIENGRMNVPEPEYLEVAPEEVFSIGEALVLNAEGKLTKCSATVKPTYIAMGQVSKTAQEREIAVCRVEDNQVYEVACDEVPAALKVGNKVTISTDALKVTATTTDGVATVVSLNGATVAGDKICVRFT